MYVILTIVEEISIIIILILEKLTLKFPQLESARAETYKPRFAPLQSQQYRPLGSAAS